MFRTYNKHLTSTEEPAERPENIPDYWEFIPYDADEDGTPAGWAEPEEEAQKRSRGYCGLSVKAEP